MLGGLKFVKLGPFWKIIAHSRALTQPSCGGYVVVHKIDSFIKWWEGQKRRLQVF